MQSSGVAVSKTISLAGFGIRRDLKKIYGSPEAAEEAVRVAMEDTQALEMWASMVTAKRHQAAMAGETFFVDEYGTAFSFDALLPAIREVAAQAIAVSMLVWTAKQEGRL